MKWRVLLWLLHLTVLAMCGAHLYGATHPSASVIGLVREDEQLSFVRLVSATGILVAVDVVLAAVFLRNKSIARAASTRWLVICDALLIMGSILALLVGVYKVRL